MKLELKHLALYLPYGLKLFYTHTKKIGQISNIYTIGEGYDNDDIKISIDYSEGEHIWMYKPILRPLSDFFENVDGVSFSNMITHGYHNSFWHKDNFNVKHLMYHDFQLLVSKHADVFGLIDKELAINRNTIIDDIINEDNEIDNFSDRFHPNN